VSSTLIHAKKWSTGPKWAIFGLSKGCRGPKRAFFVGLRPDIASILTFRGEFHLVPAKKMAKWASNWLKLPKMAIFGRFGACRGPQMARSNLFRPNITYPNIFTLIFSKKKEIFFFFEFNNPTSP